MAEITDNQLSGVLNTLAELAAQVIKNALKRDQVVTAELMNQYIEKARQEVHPENLAEVVERLKRG